MGTRRWTDLVSAWLHAPGCSRSVDGHGLSSSRRADFGLDLGQATDVQFKVKGVAWDHEYVIQTVWEEVHLHRDLQSIPMIVTSIYVIEEDSAKII